MNDNFDGHMTCKACHREYDIIDGLKDDANEYEYSYHPSFGECFLCFCYATFGGVMEPWGNEKTRAQQIYQITPPGVPSPTFKLDPGDVDNW